MRSDSSRRSADWSRLLPEHRLGLEEAGLELRIAADEIEDRLGQEGEILLERADLLEAVHQIGEADPDELVLLAHRVERARRAARIGSASWEPPAAAGPQPASAAAGHLVVRLIGLLPKRFLKDVQPEDMHRRPPPTKFAKV